MKFFGSSGQRRDALRGWIILALAAGLAVSVVGCGVKIPGIPTIAPTANPNEEVSSLSADLEAAQSAHLDVLAPTWFGRAQDSEEEAKTLLKQGGAVQSILKNVAEGRASLAQAKTFAEVSEKTLPAVIKAREDALAAGAEDLGGDYTRLERKFLELTAAVENDDLNWARRTAPSVEKEFRGLELESIKHNTAERIADLIAKAKEDGAARYAPKALQDVEKRYADLDSFISNNRYASEAIGERAGEVLFYANRVVHLTEEAKRLEQKKVQDIALENEAFLATVAQKLELPDLRNQSQPAQQRLIENAIDELQSKRLALRAKVDSLEMQTASQLGRLEEERQRLASLEADRQFNQRFMEVSSMFKPGEAEVYKEGSQVVIRLRTIQFPVGTAIVEPQSYPVLAKVQSAIKTFDKPRVTVEGHTDSTGSVEVNDRISQERADAVEAYLVNNKTIDASLVSAVGKGFSEPLASDRTAEGRAENRRIDVVIDPRSSE